MNAFKRWIINYWRPPKEERIDLSKRTLFAAGLGGLLGVLLFRSTPQATGQRYNPALIRPPGSIEEKEFLAKCIKCGECMKVCPTNSIQPAFLEAGLEGMWTPVLKMKIGYCEFECTLCGQVCPTDAIRELELEKKKKLKIGQAFFDTNRCLPYAFARSCIVCEEHCPTSPKAIWTENVEVRNSAGEMVILKKPHVDPVRCIGCGICEEVCPLKDQSGIYVTSAGEARNPDNQFLLTLSADPYGGGGTAPSTEGTDPYGGGSSPY